MISENVKISFCNYAINFKAPRNVSKSSEREIKLKSTTCNAQEKILDEKPEEYGKEATKKLKADKLESESDSTVSGPKSLPTDFKVTNQQQLLNLASEDQETKQIFSHSENNKVEGKTPDKKVPETEKADFRDESDASKKSLLDDTVLTNDKQPQENLDIPKSSEAMEEILCNKDETKEPDKDETEDKTQDEEKKPSTVCAIDLNISPKSQANEKPHNDACQPIDNNKQESRHSVQVSVSKASDMNADSKVTKSETTMTSQKPSNEDVPNVKSTAPFEGVILLKEGID